ncbi:type II toxin-antitoxin system VapC family toxin [Sphingomonas sp. S1-29]|uniref:type II toxin-antitoxin system VapC family toxin n=1 Tax=Sphingomonas sp. S1-29 TaxID=2991074 RepID=UPI002240D3A2|nr:type II toxin-antitoxin system VapC family toxin [Sphingomonas sp. S1-29]UZK69834.1 type II toxin-antitoxin system VapC family toxin [Sphingomonas sp. S1-29]
MANPQFLIDSNIVIYILADASSPAALRLQEMARGSVVTSSIAYAEVMRGFVHADPATLQRAAQFFAVIEALPFDRNAAEQYSRLPFRRGSFDRLIAAHALSCKLTLVTANERDFNDVTALQVENWAR